MDRSKDSLLPVFGVRVSVTFHFTCIHIILVRFGLLSGHYLGNSCSQVDHMFSLYFDYCLVISRFGFDGWI